MGLVCVDMLFGGVCRLLALKDILGWLFGDEIGCIYVV